MRPDLAVQIFKSFIRFKLEHENIIWGHTIYTGKHRRFLEATQKSTLTIVLRAMKSTPTEALESELNIVPIDLRLEEFQRMEAMKLFQKNGQFITNNMGKTVNSKELTPLTHLGHQAKQLLTVKSKHQKISMPLKFHQKFHLLWKCFTFQIYLLLYRLNFHQTKVKRIIQQKSNKMLPEILR